MDNTHDVNVLLVVPGTGTSNNIRDILREYGFYNITYCKTLEKFERLLVKPVPDLIICSAEFPGGDSCELVRKIRLQDVGKNPFIPIITFTSEPSSGFVRKIISSGTDALIIEPFSAQQLIDRINGVIEDRKQFVATSDYLGPDRRPGSRGLSDNEVLKFDVPNTLRSKVTGEEGVGNLDLGIQIMMTQMTQYRLKRQSYQIVYLAEEVAKLYENGVLDASVANALINLQAVINEVTLRINGTPFEHISGLCQSLMQVSDDIVNSEINTLDKNIQLLTQLSLAVHVGFTANDSSQVVQKITDTVEHGT